MSKIPLPSDSKSIYMCTLTQQLIHMSLSIVSTETVFGENSHLELASKLERLGVERPLVISDSGVRDAGILQKIEDRIQIADCVDEYLIHLAGTEPSVDEFENLPTSQIDFVVAVGGGSVLDTAKVASILLTHGGHPRDYLYVDKVPGPTLPLIAIPTTSGTGSQTTQTAVITVDNIKRGISDEYIRPDLALVDPTFTYDLPTTITAHSGYDAFMHAVESYLAKDHAWVPDREITYQGASCISRSRSAAALKLIYESIEQSVLVSSNRDACRRLSLGSHLAGTAFTISGLGMVHALASSLGGLKDIPHGKCLSASTKAGLHYNLPTRKERYCEIADILGIEANDSTSQAEAFIDECIRVADQIGLPTSIANVGFDESDVETIVANTLEQERRLKTNPRDPHADALEQALIDTL